MKCLKSQIIFEKYRINIKIFFFFSLSSKIKHESSKGMVVISIVYLEESLFILKYNVENQYQILLNEIELRKILDFFFNLK